MPEPPPDRSLDAKAILIMAACCALWGGNAVAVKFAVPDLPPLGVAGLRFLVSLPILVLACYLVKQPITVRPEHWGLLAFHGFITFLQIGTFNWGTSHSEAGRAAIFINVHPLIVAPLACFLLGERMGKQGVVGILFAAVGVVLVLSSSFQGGYGNLAGDAVVLGSGFIFAVQTIAQKKTFHLIPPATLLLNQSIVAIPMFFAYSGIFEGFGSYQLSMRAGLAVLFQGLAVSGFCFSVWLILLGRYPASRLVTLAFLTPMFGVLFGRLFNGEVLTWNLIVGGMLVGMGIYLSASDRSHQHLVDDVALPGEDAP